MENPLENLLHLEPLLTLLLAYVSYILTGIYRNQKELEKRLDSHKGDCQEHREDQDEDITDINLSLGRFTEWKELYLKASDSYVTHQQREIENLWKKIGEMERDLRAEIAREISRVNTHRLN